MADSLEMAGEVAAGSWAESGVGLWSAQKEGKGQVGDSLEMAGEVAAGSWAESGVGLESAQKEGKGQVGGGVNAIGGYFSTFAFVASQAKF